MNIYITDVESDGLLDTITKIHCLSYYNVTSNESITLTDYEEIKRLFEEDAIFLMHNGVRFDIPALEKIVGIKKPEWIIDTLAISWYLFPEYKKHGLEQWGELLGVKKPEIQDWSADNIEAIKIRCEEDVKINTKLWKKFQYILNELYNKEQLIEFLKYLHFKLDCVREQEEIGLKFNVELCKKYLETWEKEKEVKVKELEGAMPKVPIYKVKTYPKAITKQDGSFSKQGELWFDLLKEEGLPIEETKEIKTIKGYKEPNANSHDQIKNWLYSIGWVPQNIKHVRNKETNEVKKIPQITSKNGGGEICDSIILLYEKEPKLALLEGLSVVSHRISILKAFIEDQKDGRIFPSMAGLTNTLRLKHKTVVNLPAVEKKYGKEVRELLVADEDSILCGSDLKNIESMTRNHYIFPYDPEYVRTILEDKTFDSHTDIAKLAGMMTEEEEKFYQWYDSQK